MNLFFVYKNQTFDFEIKTDVSIMSLKNMVSKILEKDRNSFDLFYNNKIISEKESSLYKITKGEKNVGIIVMLKRNNKNNKKNKKLDLPFLTSANQKNTIKIENDSIDNDLNLNETEIFSSSSTKKLNSYLKYSQNNHIKSKEKQNKNEYTTRNKVFEEIYNTKEDNIINLMKKLKNRLLEYDNILYENNNNQLLLYEKNIINFKEKQIQLLNKLIDHFDIKGASSFDSGKINLKDFYQELSNYNSNNTNNTFIKNYSMKKEKKIINKNISIKLTNCGESKLPKISITKNLEENSYKLSEASEDSSKSNVEEIEKEKGNLSKNSSTFPIKMNKSFKSYNVPNLSIGNITPIEKEKKKNKSKFLVEKNNFDLEKNNLINPTKIENHKEENFLSVENNKNSIIEKGNFRGEDKVVNPKKKQIDTFKKEEPKIEKNIEIPKISHLSSSKSISLDKRELNLNFDKKKIDILFDIAENKHENSEFSSEINSDSDNLNKKKQKKKEIIERNLINRKKTLGLLRRDSNIGYKIKLKEKKTTHRIKKLGNTYSDFVI